MLVIVDGPDRSGKGTFVKALAGFANPARQVHVFHNLPATRMTNAKDHRRVMLETVAWQAKLAREHPSKDFILDRGHYSEFAYGDLYRGLHASMERIRHYESRAFKDVLTQPVILTTEPFNMLLRDDGDSTFNGNGAAEKALAEVERFQWLVKASTLKPLHLTPVGLTAVREAAADLWRVIEARKVMA